MKKQNKDKQKLSFSDLIKSIILLLIMFIFVGTLWVIDSDIPHYTYPRYNYQTVYYPQKKEAITINNTVHLKLPRRD